MSFLKQLGQFSTSSRWWFQILSIFTPKLGEDVQIWLIFFQAGLVQPPTSYGRKGRHIHHIIDKVSKLFIGKLVDQKTQVDLFIGAFLKQESLEKAGHGGVSKKQKVANSQMVDDEWSWYIYICFLIVLMICDDFGIHSADFWSFCIISLLSFFNF